MPTKESFLSQVKMEKDIVNSYEKLCKSNNVSEKITNLYKKMGDFYCDLVEIIDRKNLSFNYIRQLENEILATHNYFPLADYIGPLVLTDSEHYTLERIYDDLLISFTQLQFSLDFFKKLGFLDENIVAIGANGSGKTSLAEKLKSQFIETGVVISAQKILLIPNFTSVSGIDKTSKELKEYQNTSRNSKVAFDISNRITSFNIVDIFGNEFTVLLNNLFAERNEVANNFLSTHQKGNKISETPSSRLDKTLEIWNLLLEHRTLKLDGLNLCLDTENTKAYPAHEMSDGEKIILYYIAHILQAPESGFIVVDEPEMYLHKTLLNKLWDILEKEREDCIFIYLTHDLDFATTRTAKKIWIKSFTYPQKWKLEPVPENEIPENLLMELLGSRKNILFCEGEKGSIDEKIYNILFPNFTVTPLKGCFEVISQTKAFNKLKNVTTKAFGLIDSDHHDEARLTSLRDEQVFSLSVAEAENLLLDDKFLLLLATQLMCKNAEKTVEEIMLHVVRRLQEQKELQISNYLSAKVNYYFTDSDLHEGNTFDKLKDNFQTFIDNVKLDDWILERESMVEKIIADNDYIKAVKIINDKAGLKEIARKSLGISNSSSFENKAISFLSKNLQAQEAILKHFSDELKNKS